MEDKMVCGTEIYNIMENGLITYESIKNDKK
jgi:hypothetical protein